jgi:cytoskeletal protein CcmA (bactofilin family)
MDVKGDITFEGVLRVEGRVNGQLYSPDDNKQEHGIVLEKTGCLKCQSLSTGHFVVAGELEAEEVQVATFLHIKSTARIRNCRFICDRFQVDDGADISGCTFNKICRGIPDVQGE